MKIVAFRRYYRSIRHYAVNSLSEAELERREQRISSSVGWRIFFRTYELIFMTKPPVEHHSNMLPENGNGDVPPTQSPNHGRTVRSRFDLKELKNSICLDHITLGRCRTNSKSSQLKKCPEQI